MQRQKAKQTFRKNKAKIALGKKKAAKKVASPEQLKKRAEKAARNILIKKITKDKDKSDLSFAQRTNIEKQLEKKKGAIKKIAKKLLPQLRKDDREKKAAARGKS
jgi:precorrin-2 methylase